MRKIAVLLIVGLVVLSLFQSSLVVLAQEDDEPYIPDEPDQPGDDDDGGTGGEPPGVGEGDPLDGTSGQQGEGSSFEIPMVVLVVIVIVAVAVVVALLVRRGKSEEVIQMPPELSPPPVQIG